MFCGVLATKWLILNRDVCVYSLLIKQNPSSQKSRVIERKVWDCVVDIYILRCTKLYTCVNCHGIDFFFSDKNKYGVFVSNFCWMTSVLWLYTSEPWLFLWESFRSRSNCTNFDSARFSLQCSIKVDFSKCMFFCYSSDFMSPRPYSLPSPA